jgi:1,6-anhydro-N-acetylmuramate kinase
MVMALSVCPAPLFNGSEGGCGGSTKNNTLMAAAKKIPSAMVMGIQSVGFPGGLFERSAFSCIRNHLLVK